MAGFKTVIRVKIPFVREKLYFSYVLLIIGRIFTDVCGFYLSLGGKLSTSSGNTVEESRSRHEAVWYTARLHIKLAETRILTSPGGMSCFRSL